MNMSLRMKVLLFLPVFGCIFCLRGMRIQVTVDPIKKNRGQDNMLLDAEGHPKDKPRQPGSAEAWDLELASFQAGGRTDLSGHIRSLFDSLWDEIEAREKCLSDPEASNATFVSERRESGGKLIQDATLVIQDEQLPEDAKELLKTLTQEVHNRSQWLAA